MENLLNRIGVNPDVMSGKPIIKGTRLTVGLILDLLSQGLSIDNLLLEYPNIKKEDVYACFLYASNF